MNNVSDAVDTDILVAGAGPTGLTLANWLLRFGQRCRLIDKASAPSTTSKAIGLQFRASEILACMGLAERFLAHSAQQTTVRLCADGRQLASIRIATVDGKVGPGGFIPRPLILPQSATEALLGEALRELGGEIEWGKELVSVADEGVRVTATLASGERIRARYLVSCEGAHSVARKSVGVPFEGKTFPHDLVMADVAMETNHDRGQGYAYLHPDGAVSVMALPQERRWRVFIDAGRVQVDEVTLDLVRALYAERTGDRRSVLSDPTWLTRFKIHSRVVQRFRVGRVFLAGDAAHLHSPTGGQGITTGMQDATNLAWKLTQVMVHGAADTLLDTYDEERRKAALAVLASTNANTQLLFARGVLAKWFRNRVFMPILATQFVQRKLIRKLSQLDVGYRDSSLSRMGPPRRSPGIHAGDRAPDALMGDASLFSLLSRGKWVALLGSADRELEQTLSSLGIVVRVLPEIEAVRKIYGTNTRDVWLIRPDGYVLARFPRDDRKTLRSVLSTLWPAHGTPSTRAASPAQSSQSLRDTRA